MRKLFTLLMLVTLLTSQVPTEVLAQPPSGGTEGTSGGSASAGTTSSSSTGAEAGTPSSGATTPGTGETGTTTSSSAGAGSIGYGGLGPGCNVVSMDGEDIQNLMKNIYGRGFQNRDYERNIGDEKALDIIKNGDKKAEEDKNALSAGSGKIPLPESRESKAYGLSNWMSKDKLDPRIINRADKVIFRKDNGVTYTYIAPGTLDNSLTPYGAEEKSGEETLEAARQTLSEWLVFKIPATHDIIRTSDFYFNEWKNPQTNTLPDNFNVMIYTHGQKEYDKWLPLFEVGGLFFPTTWVSQVGKVKSSVKGWVNMFERRFHSEYKDVTYYISEAIRLQKEGRAREAEGIIRRIGSMMSANERAESVIKSADNRFLEAIRGGEETVSGLGKGTFESGVEMLGREFEPYVGRFEANEGNLLRFIGADEHGNLLHEFDVNAYAKIRNTRLAEKTLSLDMAKELDLSAVDMLAQDTYKKSGALEILKSYKEGTMDKEKALAALNAVGYRSPGSAEEIIKSRGIIAYTKDASGTDIINQEATKLNLMAYLSQMGARPEEIEALSRASASGISDESVASYVKTYMPKPEEKAEELLDRAYLDANIGKLVGDLGNDNREMLQMIDLMKQYGELTSQQENMLKRLVVRPMLGIQTTTGQTVMRLLYKETLLYWMAHSPPFVDQVVSNQIEFTLSDEAKNSKVIKDSLGNVTPYLSVLTNDFSYLSGYVQLLSYIGIPEGFKRWLGYVGWRFGSFGTPEKVKTGKLWGCAGDEGSVGKTVWYFTTGEKPFIGRIGEEADIYLILPSEKTANTFIYSDEYAHSFVTEDDYKECGPTIITRTHGLDIAYAKLTASSNDPLNVQGGKLIESMFKAIFSGDKTNMQKEEKGVYIKDYLKAKAEGKTCADLVMWGCWGSQLVPIVDLFAGVYCSYEMQQCVDSDYWVHFTKPLNQDEGTKSDIMQQIQEQISKFGGGSEGESGTAGGSTGGETGAGTASATGSTGGPTGSAAVGTFEKETLEGAGLVTGAAGEGEAGGGEETTTIPSDDAAVTAAKKDIVSDLLSSLIGKKGGEGDITKDLLGEIGVKKEGGDKDLYNLMMWLHGRHSDGLVSSLRTSDLGLLHIKPGGTERPNTWDQKEEEYMIDPKTGIVYHKDKDGATVSAYDDTTGKLQPLFDMVGDLWKSRMFEQNPLMGRILPREAVEISYSDANEPFLKTKPDGTDYYKFAAGGARGQYPEATRMTECLIDYLNRYGKDKDNKEYGWENFGDRLGRIDSISTTDGSQVITRTKGKIKVMSGQAELETATEVEIRVDGNVYANGKLLGVVDTVQTESATMMWDHQNKRVYVWLSKIFVGEDQKNFAPGDKGDDKDSDGLTAEQENALGTSDETKDTDGDGIPDGYDKDPTDTTDADEQDVDGDGKVDSEDSLICTVDGLALKLGNDFDEAISLIGPTLSIQTNGTEVTFIAEEVGGDCNKYIKVCSRTTGRCDSEQIDTKMGNNGVDIIDDENEEKVMGGGKIIRVWTMGSKGGNEKKLIKLDHDGNQPTLQMKHLDEEGNVVDDSATFGPEPVEKVRGTKGFAFYNPETGQWEFYNGYDIPNSPDYKNGMTYIPNSDGSMSGTSVNFFAPSTPTEKKDTGNLIAQLPWFPDGGVSGFTFIVGALCAVLVIRRRESKKRAPHS